MWLGDRTFEKVNPTYDFLGCCYVPQFLRQSEWLSSQCTLDSSKHHFHRAYLGVQSIHLLGQARQELFPLPRFTIATRSSSDCSV